MFKIFPRLSPPLPAGPPGCGSWRGQRPAPLLPRHTELEVSVTLLSCPPSLQPSLCQQDGLVLSSQHSWLGPQEDSASHSRAGPVSLLDGQFECQMI